VLFNNVNLAPLVSFSNARSPRGRRLEATGSKSPTAKNGGH